MLSTVDSWTAVARVCALLVRADSDLRSMLPGALAELVRGTGLRSAVLRQVPSGRLLAMAGDTVAAVQAARPSEAPARRPGAVELAVHGLGGVELAALIVVGARTDTLPALRACAAVLGLALAAHAAQAGPPAHDAGALLEAAESERGELADALHDGPVQDLLAARYAADLAERTGDVPALRNALQQTLVGLRRSLWHIRPRGGPDLPAALEQLGRRLAEAGKPPLLLRTEPGAQALTGPGATTAYRLVQALGLARGAGQPPLEVTLRVQSGQLLLDVPGAPLTDPDRWLRRARALRGDLRVDSGGVRLALPLPVRTDPVRTDAVRAVRAGSDGTGTQATGATPMAARTTAPSPVVQRAAHLGQTARAERATSGSQTSRPDTPTTKAAP